jgi:hypothetical protein
MRGVAAPERFRLVERRTGPYRHEHVLEWCALARVNVDVASGHTRNTESLGELSEVAVATAVVAGERALELDPETVRAERT